MGCFCSFRKDSPEDGEVHRPRAEATQHEAAPPRCAAVSGLLDPPCAGSAFTGGGGLCLAFRSSLRAGCEVGRQPGVGCVATGVTCLDAQIGSHRSFWHAIPLHRPSGQARCIAPAPSPKPPELPATRRGPAGQADGTPSSSLVSPFEMALSKGHAGASPPRILFQAATPGNVVSPFDSATSSEFLSTASLPRGVRGEGTARSGHSRGERKRNSSKLEMALIGFDLDEHAKRPAAGPSSTDSQPPSPKTPQQSARSSDSSSMQLEAQYMDLDSARRNPNRDPLRGHPRCGLAAASMPSGLSA